MGDEKALEEGLPDEGRGCMFYGYETAGYTVPGY